MKEGGLKYLTSFPQGKRHIYCYGSRSNNYYGQFIVLKIASLGPTCMQSCRFFCTVCLYDMRRCHRPEIVRLNEEG